MAGDQLCIQKWLVFWLLSGVISRPMGYNRRQALSSYLCPVVPTYTSGRTALESQGQYFHEVFQSKGNVEEIIEER